MKGFPRYLLVCIAIAQMIVSACILSWALPLFANPPILGNGIEHAAQLIRELAQSSPDEQRIAAISQHLRWLFARHHEGVLVAIGASGVLLMGAVAIATIALCSPRRAQRNDETTSSSKKI